MEYNVNFINSDEEIVIFGIIYIFDILEFASLILPGSIVGIKWKILIFAFFSSPIPGHMN